MQYSLDQTNLMPVYWEGSNIIPKYCEISSVLSSLSCEFLSRMGKVKIYPFIQTELTKLGVEVYASGRNKHEALNVDS